MKAANLILFLFSFGVFAQAPTPEPKPTRTPETRQERRERMRTQMREQMRESRRILQQFLNDDMFTGLRQQFEQMMEQMESGSTDSFDQFFDDDVMERLFRGQQGRNAFGSLTTGQSRWIETPKDRTLVLKLEAAKNNPIDFKIEGSRLTISGHMERRHPQGVAKQSFTRTFEIPRDCDPTQAKFENKDGEILIKFPKIAAKDGRLPVRPSESDSTI